MRLRPEQGVIVEYSDSPNKRYGYIETHQKERVHFHINNCALAWSGAERMRFVEGVKFVRYPCVGDRVVFLPADTGRGRKAIKWCYANEVVHPMSLDDMRLVARQVKAGDKAKLVFTDADSSDLGGRLVPLFEMHRQGLDFTPPYLKRLTQVATTCQWQGWRIYNCFIMSEFDRSRFIEQVIDQKLLEYIGVRPKQTG